MSDKPVSGEEFQRRFLQKAMANMSKNSKSDSDEDPIEDARRTKKQMMADDMLGTEVARQRAEKAKAEAEARKAEAEATKAEAATIGSVEPPFKISGSMNLGNINYQEMLEKAQKEKDDLRLEADQQARSQAGISDSLREKLYEKNLEIQRIIQEAKMERLTDMIKANVSRKSFMEEYNEAMTMANTMGLIKPSAEVSDMKTQLEIKRMDFENARELRRMAREDKEMQRRWELELRRLDDERDARQQELEEKRAQREMFAKAPETFARVVARGMIEDEVEEPPMPRASSKQKSQGKSYHLEVGVGESGETECPSCSQPIGIGPTATRAVCANCGLSIPIKRKGEAPVESE